MEPKNPQGTPEKPAGKGISAWTPQGQAFCPYLLPSSLPRRTWAADSPATWFSPGPWLDAPAVFSRWVTPPPARATDGGAHPLPVLARACGRRSYQLVASACLGWKKEWPRQSRWSFSKNRRGLGDRSPGAYLFHYCPKHPFIKECGTVWITQKQRSIAVIPESKTLQGSKSSRTYETAHCTGNSLSSTWHK